MVFGLQASFRLDSIKILKTLNNFSVHHASVQRSYKDTSAVELNFYLPEAKSFIYYNPQTLPDSLEIRWAPKKGKCCGEPFTFYGIDEIKFNSTIVPPQNNIYILTK
ncbi:MAG TPA: hypothetical protein VER36_04285 [Flavisolibacter sp.]|nr:hypothetical protein [Flavisolibacter sp.]